MKTLEFRVSGMHCAACPALIDELIAEDSAVVSVVTTRQDRRVRAELKDDEDASLVLDRWNAKLSPLGYQLFLPSARSAPGGRRDTLLGLLGGASVLGLFVLLQASGWLTLFAPETLEVPGAVLLGFLASVSSCFALVGGLLMTFTASVGQRHPQRLPAALAAFHVGRLLTFGVLGGVLGQLGEMVTFDPLVYQGLFLVAALTMIFLGMNLLGLVPFPSATADRTKALRHRLASAGTTGAGLLLGVSTFLLPCGFTQTVQFQALASGSFAAGAALLLAFALGTLPVLLLVSVALKNGLSGPARRILLAGSGVVVFGLGLFQLQSALVLLRLIQPVLVL